MSDKLKSSTGEDLLKNIGNKLKKQKDRNKSKKITTNEKEKTDSVLTKPDSNETTNSKTAEEKGYMTTYNMKPKYEKIYMDLRFKIRNSFKTSLSKQDAIEIGMLFLNSLDESLLNEVNEKYSPDDNCIEGLKKLIEENIFKPQ